MRFATARQVWHDAFDTPSAAFDFEAIAGASTAKGQWRRKYLEIIRDEQGQITGRIPMPITFGVETRVGKGSTAKVMDACEKGIAQRVISKVRQNDPLAYCWGMAAYAPPGRRTSERAALLQHLMEEFDTWGEPHDRGKVQRLALFCILACCLRDVNGRHVDLRQARKILGVDKKAWDLEWKKVWQRLQRRLDPLPARALGPVAELVEDYQYRRQLDGNTDCA